MDWRGFELHPEIPLGGMPIERYFPGHKLEGVRKYLHDFARSFGVEDMKAPGHLPNTRRILAVSEMARDLGKLEPFRERAMNAYWREGRNVEDMEVIRIVAADSGLDAEAAAQAASDPSYLARVEAMRGEASEAGVTGIPTFFFDDRMVVGCQPYDVLTKVAVHSGAKRRTL